MTFLDLNKAKNGTYTLKIKANPNGNAKAYVKAWVDFTNNMPDDAEGSVVKAITANGDHTFKPNAIPGLTGGLVDQPACVSVSQTNAGDIEEAYRTAFSGGSRGHVSSLRYPPKVKSRKHWPPR